MSSSSTNPFQRHTVFAHVTAEKAPLYRAIMLAFVAAKQHFALHLRPQDVVQAIRSESVASSAEGGEAVATDELVEVHEEGIETALRQLCDWGNLERHVDTTEVATLADFYRSRFLYQLTASGEAAERALDEFHRQIEQPGELQTAALQDIHEHLLELLDLARSRAAAGDQHIDAGKVDRNLTHLNTRFQELTSRAQTFISSLQRTIDLQGVEVEEFLYYKELLIDYLERFIGELVVATANIATTLERIESAGIDPLLELVARRRVADQLTADESAVARNAAEWRARWRGLSSWFAADDGSSQAEILRARARSAIPALLHAVAAIHDRRVTRSDRSTDLRTLARWFAQTDDDADAHRLWHCAFALGGSRHLKIDSATLDEFAEADVSPRTSWLDAPPLRLTPRLRTTGRYQRRGRTAKVIDRSDAKRQLELLAAEQRRQIDAARDALATDGAVRLSEIGSLDRDAFHLFLDLLGQALARRGERRQTVTASSSDGALEIVLQPLDDGTTATLETDAGFFSGRDHRVEIRPTVGLGP